MILCPHGRGVWEPFCLRSGSVDNSVMLSCAHDWKQICMDIQFIILRHDEDLIRFW